MTGAAEAMLAPARLPGRLAFAPDGALLAAACDDSETVRLWDPRTGRALATFAIDADATCVDFAPDGAGLLIVSGDVAVHRLDVTAGPATVSVVSEGPWGEVAAVSRDGEFLAALAGGPESGTVRIWDIAAGAPHATLAGHDRGWAVTTVAFSPDSTLVATGSQDWTARIWDARDGTLRTTLTCDEAVYRVVFSPEGSLLAAVSADRTIWVWDLATATARTVIRSPDFVGSAAFLAGGRYLATATDTGTSRIWDTGAGPVTTVPAVTLVALMGDGYAALLPDGRYKLSGDAGNRLWWLDGLHRLGPDELDAGAGDPRRLPAGERLLPGA